MTIDRRAIALYNEFIHSTLPRRDFMARLTAIAGSSAAAFALLPLLECNYAKAAQIEANDKRLETSRVTYKSAAGEVKAYMARPKGKGKLPAIVVVHENRGLNPHIEDVARRAAVAGYLAIAPDGLSTLGGTPADNDAARDAFAKADPVRVANDIIAAVPYVASHPECTGKVGSVGFCYGGGIAMRCAVDVQGLSAAVAFYGRQLTAEQTAKVKVPLLLHYAGDDANIDAGIHDFRVALDANKVAYSLNMYPGTGHGFHNDTSEARYNKEAATLAWHRSIDFFNHYLKPGEKI